MNSRSCFSAAKIFFLLFTAIFLDSCDLPPHHAKVEPSVPDTIYIDSSRFLGVKKNENLKWEYQKLDYRVLKDLFHSDSIGREGFIYWKPFVDEQMEINQPSSLCSTRIDDIYYFRGEKNKWAFMLFVTYDEFAGNRLQISAPVIGGAVFRRTEENYWRLWNLDKTITRHGQMGEIQSYDYVLYGKFNHAIHLKHRYTESGITSEYDYYYDLRTMKEIFSYHSGQTNAPDFKKGDPNYFSYSSEISFTKPAIEASRFYDMEVNSSGFNRDFTTDSILKINAVLLYRYNVLRGVYEPACEK